jgi:hypothetical protein
MNTKRKLINSIEDKYYLETDSPSAGQKILAVYGML